MADEEVQSWTTDPWAVGFVLIFLIALLNAFVNGLENRFGITGDNAGGLFSGLVTGELQENSPLGTKIYSTGLTNVYDAPQNGARLGTHEKDALGETVDGPVLVDDTNWWNIDFLDAPDGWVSGENVGVARVSSLLGANTPLGTVVRSVTESEIFSNPGGALVGFVPGGIAGTLIGGPSLFDGVRWWEVEFENGVTGWISERALEIASVGGILDFVGGVTFWYTIFALLFSVGMMVLITFVILKINRLRQEELHAIWRALPTRGREIKNEKWEQVIEEVNGDSPNDWRHAVLQADIMLDDLTIALRLPGDTLGERLKAATKGDFATLDLAWEAHRVRNKIAHEGSDFILTQREARRVVEMYRQVFEEFHLI